jgi:hypothetical protein
MWLFISMLIVHESTKPRGIKRKYQKLNEPINIRDFDQSCGKCHDYSKALRKYYWWAFERFYFIIHQMYTVKYARNEVSFTVIYNFSPMKFLKAYSKRNPIGTSGSACSNAR